jgi:hypothetical protein
MMFSGLDNATTVVNNCSGTLGRASVFAMDIILNKLHPFAIRISEIIEL